MTNKLLAFLLAVTLMTNLLGLGVVNCETIETAKLQYNVVARETPKIQYNVAAEETPKPSFSEDDLLCLAVVIYQEAGGDYASDWHRQLVGNVVLNRVASGLFPNTIREVATEKWQYGTLWLTGIVWPERASSPQEEQAIQRSYHAAKALLEGLRVCPSNILFQSKYVQGDFTWLDLEGTYFCGINTK